MALDLFRAAHRAVEPVAEERQDTAEAEAARLAAEEETARLLALSQKNEEERIAAEKEAARAAAEAEGLQGNAVEVAAGQGALSQLVFFPVALILVFAALYMARNWMQETSGDELEQAHG